MWIVDLKITEIDKAAYNNWQKIFSESMEDYVDRQAVFDLKKYVIDLDF